MIHADSTTGLDFHGPRERALRAWRRGDQIVSEARPSTRAAYDAAVSEVAPRLDHLSDVADLVDAYYCRAPGIRDEVEQACRRQPDGDFLVRSLVEDAAYWRRLRALLSTAAAA